MMMSYLITIKDFREPKATTRLFMGCSVMLAPFIDYWTNVHNVFVNVQEIAIEDMPKRSKAELTRAQSYINVFALEHNEVPVSG